MVVIVSGATAYDTHVVRQKAPPGISPYGFLTLAAFDLILFVIFFAGAIYFRKRAAEHKTLMLLTAINFLPAALGRIPLVPENFLILWAFGMPSLMALGGLTWFSVKNRKLNKIFAFGVFLLIASYPLRIYLMFSENWLRFVNWLV